MKKCKWYQKHLWIVQKNLKIPVLCRFCTRCEKFQKAYAPYFKYFDIAIDEDSRNKIREKLKTTEGIEWLTKTIC